MDRHGVALAGYPGAIDGATVFYGDAERPRAGVRDMDVLVKAETSGVEQETILRSERSPRKLYFRVSVPQGARLAHSAHSGVVQVVFGGSVIASVDALAARDAEGTPVPLAVGLSGHILTVSMKRSLGEYRFPIAVDPKVTDSQLNVKGAKPTNWHFEHSEGTAFTAVENTEEKGWTEKIAQIHTEHEWGAFVYTTQGTSYITEAAIEGVWNDSLANVENLLLLVNPSKVAEGTNKLPVEYAGTGFWSVCAPQPECLGKKPAANNSAEWLTTSIGEGVLKKGENTLKKTQVTIEQTTLPEFSYNKTSPTLPDGSTNILYGSGSWMGPEAGGFEIKAHDSGIGISWVGVGGIAGFTPIDLLESGQCLGGVQCPENFNPIFKFKSGMPSGEDNIETSVYNSVGSVAYIAHQTIKVDGTAPHNLLLNGLPASHEIGGGSYTLTGEATDGETGKPSSGIKSIGLKIDGNEVGTASGSCSPGPCTAKSSSWTINGHEYAAGKHTFTITARDNVGNVATENITVTVRSAKPVTVGPGEVNPGSGEFSLQAGDVSQGEGLSVSRSYRSQGLTEGAGGPLGPQWAIDMGSVESLEPQPDGSVVLTGADGRRVIFSKTGESSFKSPEGDANLVLSYNSGAKEYTLANSAKGTSTRFTLPSGGTLWMPTIQEGALATETTTYSYETVTVSGKKLTRPVKVLAPVPAGVSCSPEMKRGCRELTFNYATSTTATSESSSGWGDYIGNLTRVYVISWDPASEKMTTVNIAQYSYDTKGRLRAEWDPLISPALKTEYGYDSEGHVTALTPPGQETWAFTYGTTSGDTSAGRLLKVMQAPVAASLWNGETLKNTTVPSLSGGQITGTRMTVSDGSWTGGPVAYGYQWQQCNSSGGECKAIAGATNPNYTPVSGDIGHKLVAQVTAINGGGSLTVSSAASAKVVKEPPLTEYSLSSGFTPEGIAVGSDGKLWVSNAAQYTAGSKEFASLTTAGAITEYARFKETEPNWLAAGPDNNLWFGAKLGALGKTTTSGSVTDYPVGHSFEGLTAGPDGNMWLADDLSYIAKSTTSGAVTFYSLPAGTFPAQIASGSDGALWFTEWSTAKIGRITTSGAITEYALPAGKKPPYGITKGPDGNLWFVRRGEQGEAGSVGKITTGGTITEYSLPSGSDSLMITSGPDGALWFTEPTSDKIGHVTTSGTITETALPHGSMPFGIIAGPDGNMWFTNRATGKVSRLKEMFTEGEVAEGELRSPQPGYTVEYGVPVSGAGAPYTMSSTEVAKWAQTDTPSYATAIFPPDKSQGWPAGDYKRATIYYIDEKSRTVNIASAAGGISTAEYNENNDITRELSADNRVTALAEGSKSAEVSQKLDVQETYGSEGSELSSQLGPLHTVKLANGEEVSAREHTVYSYDEGAPGGKTYKLVTKVTEGAQIEGKPEADTRTTTTSYAGQEGLGWTLREPTSVTTDPSGLKLTVTTIYDSATGNVKEIRKPASGGEGNAHDTKTIYYSSAANETYPSCGGHAEWADRPCEILPGAQPETSGIPNLPVTVTTYNVWLQPKTIAKTVGTDTRTTTFTYDEAGRVTKASISSTVGTALPEVKDEYDSKTGTLVKQSTTTEGVTTSLSSAFNTQGNQTSYTDADGNASSFEYDAYGRLASRNDGKGTQSYKYDANTGLETEVVDSAAGTFTATYDAEGNVLTETSPNGLTASYTYNQVGETTKLEDKKSTFCGTSCTWFKETQTQSIHAQTISDSNTLAQNTYKYDEASRLTEVKETPMGEGCTTRVYGYDTETNRTSLTTYAPGAGGVCSTESGSVANHSYDSGNRLTDSGVQYDSFGNTTVLSAADAGGSGLTSTFYANNRLASLAQAGETISYHPDPSGRTRETVSTGTTSSTIVSHYANSGDSPAWTVDLAAKWTRYIPGIGGSLAAIQTNGETPVMQVSDLQGNIVATASRSIEATALLSTTRNTEYGVPTTGTPPKYSWLGGAQRPTELPTGIVAMGARGYDSSLGRFLQTDPVPGGSDNSYAYTNGDPVNSRDLSGGYVENDYLQEFNEEENERAIERRIAAEEAAREEAERKAEEAQEAAEAAETATQAAGGQGGHRHHHGGGMATISSSRRGGPYKGSHPGLTPEKVCIDFKAIGGPLVGKGRCIHLKWHKTFSEDAAKWVKKQPVLKTLFSAGQEIFKAGNEAAKASGVSWKDLYEVFQSIPW